MCLATLDNQNVGFPSDFTIYPHLLCELGWNLTSNWCNHQSASQCWKDTTGRSRILAKGGLVRFCGLRGTMSHSKRGGTLWPKKMSPAIYSWSSKSWNSLKRLVFSSARALYTWRQHTSTSSRPSRFCTWKSSAPTADQHKRQQPNVPWCLSSKWKVKEVNWICHGSSAACRSPGSSFLTFQEQRVGRLVQQVPSPSHHDIVLRHWRLLSSMDWLGNSRLESPYLMGNSEIRWFPVGFPLNQSIDKWNHVQSPF